MVETSQQPTLSPDTVVGNFRVRRLLGMGTFGAVYEAEWLSYKKIVALKILHKHLTQHPEALARFKKEAEAASEVQHDHIVQVLHVGEHADVPFVVMEMLHGESFAEVLGRDIRLTVENIVDIMIPVISAVSAMHDVGLVHRDLKPANIFLTRDSRKRVQPKVLDFGLVKFLSIEPGQELTRTEAVLGTPQYMSPEQARNSKSVGPASDQFSLGAILYVALTRKKPYSGTSTYEIIDQVVHGQYARPSMHWPAIPPALEAVVVRAMDVNPEKRFGSLQEFGRALLAFASTGTRTLWSREFHPGASNPPGGGGSDGTLEPVEHGGTLPKRRGRNDRRDLAILAGVWILLAASGLYVIRGDGVNKASVRPRETFNVQVQAVPDTARFRFDNDPAVGGPLRRVVDRDGRLHRLTVQAEGYETRVIEFRDTPPLPVIELTQASVAQPPPPPAPQVPAIPAEPAPALDRSTHVPRREPQRVNGTRPGGNRPVIRRPLPPRAPII